MEWGFILPYLKYIAAFLVGIVVMVLLKKGKVSLDDIMRVKELLKQIITFTPDPATREVIVAIVTILGYITNEGVSEVEYERAKATIKNWAITNGKVEVIALVENLSK